MKGIRKLMDRIKPSFEKGGRFEKLHSTFDAFETFLFVPDHVTRNGSHIRDSIDLKRVMENLGIYEVIEEDFALCEFVDPSKTAMQQIIRQGIDLMIKELN